MQEFDPIEHFYTYLRLWWLILAAALLGGLVGFIYSQTHAPVYEAVATYMVEIDLEKVPLEELDFYYIDLALATTQGALTSNEVLSEIYAEAARLGQDTSQWDLLANTSIERRHAFWELRFRHPNPEFAQTLVNHWAAIGYQAMLQRQADQLAPAYVVYSPPSLALKPLKPLYYATNKLVFAGSLVGWVAGLLFVEVGGKRILSRQKP